MAILQLLESKIKLDAWFRKHLTVAGWKHKAGQAKSALSSTSSLPEEKPEICFERRLGDTELSYYLPSRAEGVNDMYLSLSCRINASYYGRERVRILWALMRLRHPMLASKVRMHDYDDVRFMYELPRDSAAALASADRSLEFCSKDTEELADTYFNGPRTLSEERLSYLYVNETSNSDVVECDFGFCAVHYLGDGMALHAMANEFFLLLGSEKTSDDLSKMLDDELSNQRTSMKSLPNCLEDRLPPLSGKPFQRIARRVDYLRSQEKDIGGQVFPRRSGLPRNTVRYIKGFDPERTKSMIKVCKAHGVSVSSATFAACNLAWARTTKDSLESPSLMYSALNVRPNLVKEAALHDSYWFLSIGYFNVVLPSFVPASEDLAPIFWHRSREAKKQSNAVMKTPMLTSRCREMARERSERAQVWARQDDGKPVEQAKAPVSLSGNASSKPPPSKALIGLSLLGNLDTMYKHSEYPGIKLHYLISGSRQRSGGMLLFGFTFAGRLWINLIYDENGFDKTVVEAFWNNMLQIVDEQMP